MFLARAARNNFIAGGGRKTKKVALKRKAKLKAGYKKNKTGCKEFEARYKKVRARVPFRSSFLKFVDKVVPSLIQKQIADFTDILPWRGVCKNIRDSIDKIAKTQTCHRVTYLYRSDLFCQNLLGNDSKVWTPEDEKMTAYPKCTQKGESGRMNLDIRPFIRCVNYNEIRKDFPWNYLQGQGRTCKRMLRSQLSRPLMEVHEAGLDRLSYSGCLTRYFDSEALRALGYIITMSPSAFGLRRLAVNDIIGYKDVNIQDLFAFLNSVSCLEKLEEFCLDIALAVMKNHVAVCDDDALSSFPVAGENMVLHETNHQLQFLPEFRMKTSFPNLRVFSLGGPCSRVTEFSDDGTAVVLEKVFKMVPKGLEELHLKTLGIIGWHAPRTHALWQSVPNLKKLSVTCGGFCKQTAAAFSNGLSCLQKLEYLSVAYQCRAKDPPQTMPVFTAFKCLTKLEVRVQGTVFCANFVQAFAESLASASKTLEDVSFRVSAVLTDVDVEDPTLLRGWNTCSQADLLMSVEEVDSAREAFLKVLEVLNLKSFDGKCDPKAIGSCSEICRRLRPASIGSNDGAMLTLAHAEVNRDSTPKSRLETLCFNGNSFFDRVSFYAFCNLHTLRIQKCRGEYPLLTESLLSIQSSMRELEVSFFKPFSTLSTRTVSAVRPLKYSELELSRDKEVLRDLKALMQVVAGMPNLHSLTLWDLGLRRAGMLYHELNQIGAQYSDVCSELKM
jgi:hypothetical protein